MPRSTSRRVARRLVAGGIAGLLLILVAGGGSAGAGSQRCRLAWRVMPLPVGYGHLHGLAASSASDVWAVGTRIRNDYKDFDLLLEHWDGVRWRQVSVAGAPPAAAIAVMSPSSAWAAGNADSSQRVLVRWDGRRWSLKPGQIAASDIAAAGANAAWVVGGGIASWEGQRWRVVRSPADGGGISVATFGREAWVVGITYPTVGVANSATFALHWDAKQWRRVQTPSLAFGEHGENQLYGVGGSSPTDVWAVGWWQEPEEDLGGELIEHWDGNRWSIVRTPPGSPCNSRMDWCAGAEVLAGVSATAANDAWAVGSRIEHWDGNRWKVVKKPAFRGYLHDVLALSPTNVWAVGTIIGKLDKERPLILHYSCG
jgi:hypothetical protein